MVNLRDVTFDKTIFFDPLEEAQVQLPLREYKPITELITLLQMDGNTAIILDEEDKTVEMRMEDVGDEIATGIDRGPGNACILKDTCL